MSATVAERPAWATSTERYDESLTVHSAEVRIPSIGDGPALVLRPAANVGRVPAADALTVDAFWSDLGPLASEAAGLDRDGAEALMRKLADVLGFDVTRRTA